MFRAVGRCVTKHVLATTAGLCDSGIFIEPSEPIIISLASAQERRTKKHDFLSCVPRVPGARAPAPPFLEFLVSLDFYGQGNDSINSPAVFLLRLARPTQLRESRKPAETARASRDLVEGKRLVIISRTLVPCLSANVFSDKTSLEGRRLFSPPLLPDPRRSCFIASRSFMVTVYDVIITRAITIAKFVLPWRG